MDWEAFHPYIEPLVKGCPMPTIDQALRETAADFCSRTLVWYDTRTLAVPAAAATGLHNLPKPSDSEVAQSIRVAPVGRAPLIQLREQELDGIMDWETATDDYATHYIFVKPGRVQLYPIPELAMTLRCRSAYRPIDAASGVEDFIYENWRDCLIQGTLTRLKEIPGQFWSDSMGAVLCATKFSAAANKARNDKTRGYHNATLAVAPRRFA